MKWLAATCAALRPRVISVESQQENIVTEWQGKAVIGFRSDKNILQIEIKMGFLSLFRLALQNDKLVSSVTSILRFWFRLPHPPHLDIMRYDLGLVNCTKLSTGKTSTYAILWNKKLLLLLQYCGIMSPFPSFGMYVCYKFWVWSLGQRIFECRFLVFVLINWGHGFNIKSDKGKRAWKGLLLSGDVQCRGTTPAAAAAEKHENISNRHKPQSTAGKRFL